MYTGIREFAIGFWRDILNFVRQPINGTKRTISEEQVVEIGSTARTENLGDYPYLVYRAGDNLSEIRVNTDYARADEGFIIHMSNEGRYDSYLCASEAKYREMDQAQGDHVAYRAYMNGAR